MQLQNWRWAALSHERFEPVLRSTGWSMNITQGWPCKTTMSGLALRSDWGYKTVWHKGSSAFSLPWLECIKVFALRGHRSLDGAMGTAGWRMVAQLVLLKPVLILSVAAPETSCETLRHSHRPSSSRLGAEKFRFKVPQCKRSAAHASANPSTWHIAHWTPWTPWTPFASNHVTMSEELLQYSESLEWGILLFKLR